MQFHDPVSSSASPLTLAPLPALAASPAGPGLSRRDLLGAATLVLSLGASDLARGASIVAVRVWPAAEYTRVTLESDTNLVGQHFLTGEPARLVIDVDGLELTNTLRDLVGKVSADDPYIARVRVGQNQPGKVRIVFDLKQATRPQVFALAPIAPYRHRLVFDLYPVRPASTAVALASGDGPAAAAPAPSASPASATSINPPASAAPALGSGGLPGEAGSTTAAPASAAAGDDDIMALLTRRPDAITPPPPVLASPVPPPPTARSAAAAPGPGMAPSPATTTARSPAAAGLGNGPLAATPVAPASPIASAPATAPRSTPPALARRGGRPASDRLIIVAIDPGHGGEDPGAIGPTGLREKDVVLAIGRALAEQINSRPGMKAVLTRDADYFVPLFERVHKARRVGADLFMSIHADAFVRPHARGASVFALSQKGASSAAARWMAQRENLADAIGGINLAETQDQAILQTLLDMSTARQIRDSLQIGHEMLRHLGKVGQLHKGEVEQAGFAVLKAPDIPSILVETAFISNPQEEKRLRSEAYRKKLVQAMSTGITRYFARNPPVNRGTL